MASSCRSTRSASPPRTSHKKLSLRASTTSELLLDDVRLPVNRGMLLALHLMLACSGSSSSSSFRRPRASSRTNAALEVARSARQVLGANGITLEYPVIRHMNNLESVVTSFC